MTPDNRNTLVSQSPGTDRPIALVVKSMIGGGAERIYLNLALGLAARGHKVDLLLLKATGSFLAEIPTSIRIFALRPPIWTSVWHKLCPTSNGVLRSRHVHCLGPRWLGRRIAWFRTVTTVTWPQEVIAHVCRWRLTQRIAIATLGIAEYLRNERPHIVIPEPRKARAAVLLARRWTQIPTPLVMTFHLTLSMVWCLFDKHHRVSGRLLFPEADGFLTASDKIAARLTTELAIAPHRITTIANPVITPQSESQAREIPNHPWMNVAHRPVLLACGRLIPKKDFPTLLRAFARLTHQHTRLVILGEGKQETSLKALTCDLGLEERVSFPGWVTNPFAFMSRARLFVLSSRWETFPNVLIEAMLCGCPIVSTDCPGGPREILEEGQWGDLVPVGDDLALSQAIDRALSQKPDHEGLRGRAHAFSITHAIDQYENLLLNSTT